MQGVLEMGDKRLSVQYTLQGEQGYLIGDDSGLLDVMLTHSAEFGQLHLADGRSVRISLIRGKADLGAHVQLRFRVHSSSG